MYSEFGISIFNLDDKIFLESARKKSFFIGDWDSQSLLKIYF